jgi:PIN domain nuclease of toxin-antitoxin system
MIAYLDTNVAVRLAHGRMRAIGREASRLMARAELLVSPMVLLELEYLHEIGRLTLRGQDILRKLEHEVGLRLCDLPFADVARAALDEKWTRDTFDRIIVAQAKLNGLAPLISSDEEIMEHYPRTVW